jgi:hypothetical protein
VDDVGSFPWSAGADHESPSREPSPIACVGAALISEGERRHRLRPSLCESQAKIRIIKPRERLLKSLRVADQFHGARYELMIASCLVRAGFTTEFSDEADSTRRHGVATALAPPDGP